MGQPLRSQARRAVRFATIASVLPLAFVQACKSYEVTRAYCGQSDCQPPPPPPPPRELARVAVSLSATTIPVGQTAFATAATLDQYLAPISVGAVVWSTESAAVATVSASGLVTAVAPGQTGVIAAAGGKWGIGWISVITFGAGAPNFTSLEAGYRNACGLITGGAAYCWGASSNYGSADRSSLTPVEGGLVFASLTAGGGQACGVTTSGAAYCWGNNGSGQLGDGTITTRLLPAPISGGLVFASLTAGDGHTCGLTPAGAAYCWGSNGFGQLGDGTDRQRGTPVPVVGGLVFASLSAGHWSTCGLTTGGSAYCWGERGQTGGLGHPTPEPVAAGFVFAGLTTGWFHTCGLTTRGAAYCWGQGLYGQLGDDSARSTSSAPVPVAGGLAFASLAAGAFHTCGLTTAGAAYCWGENSKGQLGDGTAGPTANRLTPVPVAVGLVFTNITAGYEHTCGRIAGGAAYCWGLNDHGQLGDWTNIDRSVPTAVK